MTCAYLALETFEKSSELNIFQEKKLRYNPYFYWDESSRFLLWIGNALFLKWRLLEITPTVPLMIFKIKQTKNKQISRLIWYSSKALSRQKEKDFEPHLFLSAACWKSICACAELTLKYNVCPMLNESHCSVILKENRIPSVWGICSAENIDCCWILNFLLRGH